MSGRVIALLLAIGGGACADYAEFDASSTVWKCDAQNQCPDGYFCGDEPSGVCVPNGTLGCKGQELVRNWGFTTSEEGWLFDIDPDADGVTGHSIGWTPDEGSPNRGSLKLELYGSSTVSRRLGWFRPTVDHLGDMSGRWISGQIWTEHPGLIMNVYVENDTRGTGWTDGGANFLNANEWDCVGLKIDMPKFQSPSFDKTKVERLGLQLTGTLPLTIIVDDVGY